MCSGGRGTRVQSQSHMLPSARFDVILGMDYLSANRVLTNCWEKKLFSNLEEPELLSSHGVIMEIKDGA